MTALDAPGVRETYYYVGDRRVPLFASRHLFVARLGEAARLRPQALSEPARRLFAAARPVAFLARDGLTVYRTDAGLPAVEALRHEAGVDRIFAAYQHGPDSGDTVVPTPRLLAQFKPELSREATASSLERMGLRILEPLPYAPPYAFLLSVDPGSDGLGALKAANQLVEQDLVSFAEPDLVRSRHWRSTPLVDPTAAVYLDRQWHLRVVAALDAWKDTEGSADIRIAVLDDGLDTGHPEFNGAVSSGRPKVAAQLDFATGEPDASPRTYIDNHGTACAGLAAAAGVKAAGVAPACRLVIARTPDYLGVSEEATMFQWAADAGADVMTCSWGPVDGTGTGYPLPTPTRLAIRYCLGTGRAGRGIPIFWAAGNGAESVSSDGYAANPDVLAIAACTNAETVAPYSDYGPEIFACAPSSAGAGQAAIFTTDRRGTGGYNPGSSLRGDAAGDYTDSFGGTSAAAPLAAGVAALMLSANPRLPAAEVRELLRGTADRIGGASSYDTSGHSDRFGYGRINAAAAVHAALERIAEVPDDPTIVGPQSWSRSSGPPTFQVNPSPHAHYAVEIAAAPELFDDLDHDQDRRADNFYGSWSDGPLLSGPTYVLPAAVWARLRSADRLWYRVGSSASAVGYTDYRVSTPDDRGDRAPAIQVVPGLGPEAAPERARRTVSQLIGGAEQADRLPLIDGPLHWDRRLGSPILRIEPGQATAYAVEVTTDPRHFDRAAVGNGAPMPTYVSSGWIDRLDLAQLPPIGFHAYGFPLETWRELMSAPALYYRVVMESGGETAASPSYAMLLTGEPIAVTADSEPRVRSDEALWRVEQGGHSRSPASAIRS